MGSSSIVSYRARMVTGPRNMEVGSWRGLLTPGPLFLTPGLLIALSVCGKSLQEEKKSELKRYLLNKLRPEGGWGLYVTACTELRQTHGCPSNGLRNSHELCGLASARHGT